MRYLEAIEDRSRLCASQVQEIFQEQGYLFIKGFFPKEEVLALRKVVTDVLVRKERGKLSGGLHTYLPMGGTTLSGGQKQRLGQSQPQACDGLD